VKREKKMASVEKIPRARRVAFVSLGELLVENFFKKLDIKSISPDKTVSIPASGGGERKVKTFSFTLECGIKVHLNLTTVGSDNDGDLWEAVGANLEKDGKIHELVRVDHYYNNRHWFYYGFPIELKGEP
jgi:hypothetical protein